MQNSKQKVNIPAPCTGAHAKEIINTSLNWYIFFPSEITFGSTITRGVKLLIPIPPLNRWLCVPKNSSPAVQHVARPGSILATSERRSGRCQEQRTYITNAYAAFCFMDES
jgi:hypothetical protein